MTQFTRTLSHDSIVEWFWLVELFSVLSSILVSMSDSLSGPARAIPEGRVHHVARAIIKERLSRSVQIRLVLNVLVNLNSFLIRELLGRIPVLEDGLRLMLGVDIAGTEGRLIWSVLRMVMRMRLWHRLGTVSSRGGVQCLIGHWNPLSVESDQGKQSGSVCLCNKFK